MPRSDNCASIISMASGVAFSISICLLSLDVGRSPLFFATVSIRFTSIFCISRSIFGSAGAAGTSGFASVSTTASVSVLGSAFALDFVSALGLAFALALVSFVSAFFAAFVAAFAILASPVRKARREHTRRLFVYVLTVLENPPPQFIPISASSYLHA